MNDWSFQDDAVYTHLEALNNWRFTVDANRTGYGKTHIMSRVAAAVIDNTDWNVAVLSPPRVAQKWVDTLKLYGVTPIFVLSHQKLKGGTTKWVTRTGKGGKRKKKYVFTWNLPDNTFVIIDEIHEYGNSGSISSMLLTSLWSLLKTQSANNYALAGLSATLASSPLKLMVLGQMLGLHKGFDAWSWAKSLGCREGFFGGLEWAVSEKKKLEAMASLHASIFPCRGHRAKAQLQTAYQNFTFVETIPQFDLPTIVEKAIRDVSEKLEVEFNESAEKGKVVSPLVVQTRERQIAELRKTPWLYDRLLSHLESEESIVVFLAYHASIDVFAKMLGGGQIKFKIYDGRHKPKTNLESHEAFQQNLVKVLLVNVASGSESIDLHDADGLHPRVALHTPVYSPSVLKQALGRIDRLAKKSDTRQWIIYDEEGIEAEIAKTVASKLDCLDTLNDGDVDPLRFGRQKK